MRSNLGITHGQSEISIAAKALEEGHLVSFPTETVYGLGADACNKEAVARIYGVKGRPNDHPLIVHIHSIVGLAPWVMQPPEYALQLANAFWPGPMTLILKRSSLAQDFITGGQDSVGIRVPNHPKALALLKFFHELGGKGIVAPSANRFGGVSPTTAKAVKDEIQQYLTVQDLIIDGGDCEIGIESTIIDCTDDNPRILRSGAITKDMIFKCTGLEVHEISSNPIRVSGSLESHYSPKAVVILNRSPTSGEGFIALEKHETPVGVIRLAAPKDDKEFARCLYSALHEADVRDIATVVVKQPEGVGIAIAIRDRLQRASKK